MKKFVAVLMSVSLGAVLCLSNTGCPKAPDKDKGKPPPPVAADGKPPSTELPKVKPGEVKDKEKEKEKVDPAKAEPAPVKEKTEADKGKKEPAKNGAFVPRTDLPRCVAEMHRRHVGIGIAFSRWQHC